MTRRDVLIAVLSAGGAALAQEMPAVAQQDKFALANENIKQLLLLMDSDNNGRISKHEWMSFMEAEFNKLDKDGSGELDPKELLQASFIVRHQS